MTPWVLASQSPQRKTLLAGLGIAFDVVPGTVDESACAEQDPATRSLVLAEQKARDVAGRMTGRFVIGCDTLVVAPDGTLLEKPLNADDARRMLRLQSGGVSVVHSGLCIVTPEGKAHTDLSSSRVRFRALADKDIAWWIGTNLWQDRSGSFQIDGPGQLLIDHLDGDFTSVVGFPCALFCRLAEEAGRPLF